MRIFAIIALALWGTGATAERYVVTTMLLSVQIPLAWHEEVRATRETFGEGCIIDVEETFVIALEKIANTGLMEQIDPDVPFSVAEFVIFRDDQPILIFGGSSSVRNPGKVAYGLQTDTYETIRDALFVRLEAAGCFEQ